jgi:hypothetical protein
MELTSARTTTIKLDETERDHLGTIVDFWHDYHDGSNRRQPEVRAFADLVYKQLRGTR